MTNRQYGILIISTIWSIYMMWCVNERIKARDGEPAGALATFIVGVFLAIATFGILSLIIFAVGLIIKG